MQLDFFDHLDENESVGARILNWVSGAALLVAVTWFSYTLFNSREVDLPPRVINSITLEPTILLAGKPFNAHVNVTLNKLCPYEVQWSLVKHGGSNEGLEVVKIVEPVHTAGDKLGTFEQDPVSRYIPSTVEPGEYKYVSQVYDICADGHTYTSVRRNVVITIR